MCGNSFGDIYALKRHTVNPDNEQFIHWITEIILIKCYDIVNGFQILSRQDTNRSQNSLKN